MKKCELCKEVARTYCESDQASLCWRCDAKVHSANFLVARHSRSVLCHSCHSPTPWIASGAELAVAVAACTSCVFGEPENRSTDDRSQDQSKNEGFEEEEEDEDQETQAVPPPPASSSSSEEDDADEVFESSPIKKKRSREDLIEFLSPKRRYYSERRTDSVRAGTVKPAGSDAELAGENGLKKGSVSLRLSLSTAVDSDFAESD